MPFLDNIVTGLNDELKKALSFIPSSKIKSYGLTETSIEVKVESSDEGDTERQIRYPAVIDNDGEVKPVYVDDIYSLMLFHKIESIVNAEDLKKSFGDIPALSETAN